MAEKKAEKKPKGKSEPGKKIPSTVIKSYFSSNVSSAVTLTGSASNQDQQKKGDR